MPLRLDLIALALLPAIALPGPLSASGSYPPNPPRLGVTALASIDAAVYNLGKNLFIERVALPDQAPAGIDIETNRAHLSALQARLPDRVRQQVDLPALATRLDTAQLDALVYYVGIRFRVETSPPAPGAS